MRRVQGRLREALHITREALRSDDVAAVREALDRSGPAIVGGHSYSGLVVGAATHPASRELVFLAAFMADEGEDWSAAAAPDVPSALAGAMTADEHGNLGIDPGRAADILYGDCDRADVAAVARLTPQNAEPFGRTMPASESARGSYDR